MDYKSSNSSRIFIVPVFKACLPCNLFFISQASERASVLNPRVLLANHALMTIPAFYDTAAHGPDFFLFAAIASP